MRLRFLFFYLVIEFKYLILEMPTMLQCLLVGFTLGIVHLVIFLFQCILDSVFIVVLFFKFIFKFIFENLFLVILFNFALENTFLGPRFANIR